MIVRMKKITLLVTEREKEKFLNTLRKLGTVHIENIKKPESNELVKVEKDAEDAKRAVEALKFYDYHKIKDDISLNAPETHEHLEEITEILQETGRIERNLQDFEDHMKWFKPWGAFDPCDIEELKKKGVFIKLYRIAKNEYKKLKNKNIHIIKKDGGYFYCALASNDADERLPFEEIEPIEEGCEKYRKEIDKLNIKLGELKIKLKSKAIFLEPIKKHLNETQKKHIFLNVMYGMEKETNFSYLQGYCPVDKVKQIISLAKKKGFGYFIEEPDEPEKTPTLIKNPKWIRIISPVFKFMNTIPGYKEYDISIWFLMFFSIFFAMLISDAGYGLLFVILTFLARIKLKKLPPEPFRLMYILSFATLVWGAITGTWFGVEKIAQIHFLSSMVVEKINSFVDTNHNFMIYICFIIGVIHLSIAHLVIAIKKINSLKALSEIGWIAMLWGLFFTAGRLVIGKPFPYFAIYLLMAGGVSVILFSNSQKGLLKGMVLSLADLPLKIVSSFADIVSYIRLFAVGYASTVLAVTFNKLALDIGFDSVVSSLFGALILFFGHALNITLGFMAVIVHGIRLNMLEFSGQMGMEWSGNEYKPFNEEGVT